MGNNIKLKLKKMLSKFFSHPIDTISLSHVVTVPMEYLKKKQVLVENRLTNVTTDAAKSATTKFSKFASVVEYYITLKLTILLWTHLNNWKIFHGMMMFQKSMTRLPPWK